MPKKKRTKKVRVQAVVPPLEPFVEEVEAVVILPVAIPPDAQVITRTKGKSLIVKVRDFWAGR